MQLQFTAQKGIVINDREEILLIKYADALPSLSNKLNGKYALPGGKIEIGEIPDQSIISEVFDETGITCTPSIPIFVWNWEYEKGDDLIQINAIMRICTYTKGIPKVFDQEEELKITEVVWKPLTQISSLPVVDDELPGINFFLENRELLIQLVDK